MRALVDSGSRELQRPHRLHSLPLAGLVDHVLADRLVDAEQQHRLPTRIAPAEVEGADVDSSLAEQGADTADEAGRILVDDVEHVPGQLGLDADAEYLNQPRIVLP